MTPSIDNSVMKEDLSDTEEVFEEALEELSDDFENILSNETLDIASDEIGENDQTRSQALAEVTRWLQSQPHLRNSRTDSNFILRFLRTNKYKLEKTCAMIERYLRMRMDHPKWFQNLDIEVSTSHTPQFRGIFSPLTCQDPLVLELIQSGYIFVLPERDRAGRRVVWSVARALDPARHNTSHVLRAHIATFEVSKT